jgi:hypothetical protein
MEIEKVLLRSLHIALDGENLLDTGSIVANTNLFDLLDSFALVNVLLETEGAMEVFTGRYLSLADENIFDAQKSPFLAWSNWVEYVKAKHVNA